MASRLFFCSVRIGDWNAPLYRGDPAVNRHSDRDPRRDFDFGAKRNHRDITGEAADAVLLEPSLAKIDELMHIGRHMRTIALQSAVSGMALSLMGMVAVAMGYLPPVGGAVTHEFIDLAAVLNALRVAISPAEKIDF
jgi:hypothetical protein